jgi:hypothetical protein
MRALGVENPRGPTYRRGRSWKDDPRGIAVHVAARVAAHAQANECLVTRTVKTWSPGADIRSPNAAGETLRASPRLSICLLQRFRPILAQQLTHIYWLGQQALLLIS